jgi:uncharacterized membrane protein YfcA
VEFVLALAGFGVGAVVGLTGMGGGALMTPVLVLFFGIPPLAAVSSDLVISAVMKPIGAGVHLRRGTVNKALVGWLCLGSIPSAFGGVLIAKALGHGEGVQQVVKVALGIALLLAAAGLVVKSYLALVDRVRRRSARGAGAGFVARSDALESIRVRPFATVLVGVVGGLVVGMTSVGSGSLIIIALLVLYPALKANDLVGTDLVQAVPLVVSAAIAHLFFGDFRLDITVAVLAGALPGVFVGAQLSSRLPAGLVRRALAFVLMASGLKLLGLGNVGMLVAVAAVLALGPVVWMGIRVSHGLPALARHEAKTVSERSGAAPSGLRSAATREDDATGAAQRAN